MAGVIKLKLKFFQLFSSHNHRTPSHFKSFSVSQANPDWIAFQLHIKLKSNQDEKYYDWVGKALEIENECKLVKLLPTVPSPAVAADIIYIIPSRKSQQKYIPSQLNNERGMGEKYI